MSRSEELSSDRTVEKHDTVEVIAISDSEGEILRDAIQGTNLANVWEAFRVGDYPITVHAGGTQPQLQTNVDIDWSQDAQTGDPLEGQGIVIEISCHESLIRMMKHYRLKHRQVLSLRRDKLMCQKRRVDTIAKMRPVGRDQIY